MQGRSAHKDSFFPGKLAELLYMLYPTSESVRALYIHCECSASSSTWVGGGGVGGDAVQDAPRPSKIRY